MLEGVRPGHVLRTAAKLGAVGFGAALVGDTGITLRDHRELTHRSVELHPWLQRFYDWEQRTITVGEPTVWASVHRIHHQMPDGTLAPFYHITRAMNWMRDNPQLAEGVTIPDSFVHLDPFVDSFSRDDVTEIGNQAVDFMRERMGDEYEEPTGYTKEELHALFNPTKPRYFYERDPQREGDYTQDEIAAILLGDPHSPVRIPPPEENGVQGVLKTNVTLYSHDADLFRARPDLKPKDLQNEDGSNRKASRLDIAAGVLIPGVAVLLKRGKYKPKDFAKAALAGVAIDAVRITSEVVGGNITNSLGHSGTLTQKEMFKAIQNGKYKPVPNEDGTVSTNTENAGIMGRALSKFTLDEVGGQEVHHTNPEKIAYTHKTGWGAWVEAPWGSLVSVLANSEWFPLINPGPGFDLKEGETRPDMPHPAFELIHRRRVEQLHNASQASS